MSEKRFFPTKKSLKGSNVSITENLTQKRMEIVKKARIFIFLKGYLVSFFFLFQNIHFYDNASLINNIFIKNII